MPEGHSGGITDARVREIAEAAAELASEKVITRVFKKLRIRIDDDDSIDRFIDNQSFLTKLRESRSQLGKDVRGVAVEVVKKTAGYVLLFMIAATGAALGVGHLPTFLGGLRP